MNSKTKDLIWFFIWFGVFAFGLWLSYCGIWIKDMDYISIGISIAMVGAFLWGYLNHKMVSEEGSEQDG